MYIKYQMPTLTIELSHFNLVMTNGTQSLVTSNYIGMENRRLTLKIKVMFCQTCLLRTFKKKDLKRRRRVSGKMKNT